VAGEPLAHSASNAGAEPQLYRDHIAGAPNSEGVVRGARRRAEAMVRYHSNSDLAQAVIAAVVDAATFHDLGKFDPENQAALRLGRAAKLPWDHIDAGVAHLRASKARMAAWLVRAHHAPGLPSWPTHFINPNDRHLRGRRNDDADLSAHAKQIERTDRFLSRMLDLHAVAVGNQAPLPGKERHGLALRLALSCLVDADHADSARFDANWEPPDAPAPRWSQRLAALDAYVGGLSADVSERNAHRRAFYDACRHGGPEAPMVACEGPVGIGKTTAVTAYLLRRAIATGARRLFVVAPFTAILSQTADTLRKALVLENEQPDAVVAEHHHRADFEHMSSRDLATLWTAPIILTTAVQFFESLASNHPAALRKLHGLPGSAVFIDEAHAALPAHLLAQNWRWMRELAEAWGCSFVLASGSLVRYWEIGDIVGDTGKKLPELTPASLSEPLLEAEKARVTYVSRGRFDGPGELSSAVAAEPGPRLLVMNTVQSAAVMAKRMRERGHRVLHISTALCPRDRAAILDQIKVRLNDKQRSDWTLVGTSLVEAGLDFSFRTAFRERFAAASLIQIGGRANRNSEEAFASVVHDFIVSYVERLTQHPLAKLPAEVLGQLFKDGKLEGIIDPANVVTLAMQRELRRRRQSGDDRLLVAERERRYPDVAELGRVVDEDTRLIVVDPTLRNRIIARDFVSTRDLLTGSVQIHARKIPGFALGEPLPGRADIYWWPYAYDGSFLGYMEGALSLAEIAGGKVFIL
jgi:CRISPR-associated endonuclease/helicase Cas3